jgi:hypothetical protein
VASILCREPKFNPMNDLPNEPTGQNSGGGESKPTSELRSPIFDALASAVRKGAEHARKETEEGMPRLKAAAAEAAYWTVYGVVFVGVSQWTLVKAFTPEVVKKGCRDGIKGGREAAEKWVEQMRRPNQPAPSLLLAAPAPGLAMASTQPGAV